jgi:hypothetical protein
MACRVLGLSRQGYYQWLADPVCQRDCDDAHAIDAEVMSGKANLRLLLGDEVQSGPD